MAAEIVVTLDVMLARRKRRAKDLAAENPEIVARLRALLDAHKKDLAENFRPAGGPPKQKKRR